MLTPDRPRVWTYAVFDPARDVPVADVTITADPNLPVDSVRCLRSSADGGVRVFAEGLMIEVTPRAYVTLMPHVSTQETPDG